MAFHPRLPPNPYPKRPVCRCRLTYHNPGDYPDQRLWTQQVTSACPFHFRRLPVAVRIRILLNEGYRA